MKRVSPPRAIKSKKMHLGKLVTRYQGSWPTHAGMGTACGRGVIGDVEFTDRPSRVTCLRCRKAHGKTGATS
jgi:hypothetical protein